METEITTLPIPAGQNGRALMTLADDQATFLPMPVQIVQIVARVKAVKEIVSQVFEDGVHFGEIPGTSKRADGRVKKVLHKPGFDTLCMAFQFRPDYEEMPGTVVSQEFINVVTKCTLTHIPTGRVIATGIGSCNSKEEKYRWVTSNRACPQCGGEFIRTSKPEDSQGFYCWKKLGGCGVTFPKNDPSIVNQPEGRKENENAYNHDNTLRKMSQKRAGMAAIITACGLSSDFTQDLEDFTAEPAVMKPGMDPSLYNTEVYGHHPAEARKDVEKAPPPEPAKPTPAEPTAEEIMTYVQSQADSCFTLSDLSAVKQMLIAKGGTYFSEGAKEILKVAFERLKPVPAEPPTPAPDPQQGYSTNLENARKIVRDRTAACNTLEGLGKLRADILKEGGWFSDVSIVEMVNQRTRELSPSTTLKFENPATDFIRDISSKSGPNKDGGTYTRYSIESRENGFFTTFNPDFANVAVEAIEQGAQVQIHYSPNGRWKNIDSIKLLIPTTQAQGA